MRGKLCAHTILHTFGMSGQCIGNRYIGELFAC